MEAEPTRRQRATAAIAYRDIFRALALLAGVQVGGVLLFIVFSVVFFRLWVGGIFFYKSVGLATAFCLFLAGVLLRIAAFSAIDKWLTSALLHRLWFATLSAATQFCIIVLFIGFIPVTIDRSVSVYMLGTMENESQRALSTAELEDRLIQDYVHDYEAIERRLLEQVASHNVEPDGDGYRLTPQGANVVRTMRAVAWIFNLDRRFVDPAAFHATKGRDDPKQATVR